MSQDTGCQYVEHENNLHEIIFNDVSRAALDAGLDHVERILRQAGPDITVRLISDNRLNKAIPVSYVMFRGRAVLQGLPRRPALRVALAGDGFLAGIIDRLAAAILRGRDRVRFFHHSDREKMLEWLNQDD